MPDRDRRKRERSRSRDAKKRNRSPSPSEGSDDRRKSRGGKSSKAPEKSSSKQPEKTREKTPPKAAKKAPAPAAAASESESEDEEADEDAAGGDDDEEEEEVSLEAKVALLEVENATLKAENMELRKRLVEIIQKARAQAQASQAPPAAQERRRREEPEAASGGDRRAERRGGREPKEEEEPPQRRRREDPPQGSPPDEPAPSEGDAGMGPNAVMLANSQMELYNDAITNNVPLEKRLPLVKAKLERFMSHFDDKIQIIELKSGNAILKDRKMFNGRYTCVFRESGAKLKGTCNKRFFWDASGGYKATYVLDYELHESLVTALPGTPQDGNLGVRDPRTEHLIVLYEEKGGKITRMWLRPDTDKVGVDPYAGEDIIERHETYKAFEAKVKELKGGSAGARIFHNYHQVATVG